MKVKENERGRSRSLKIVVEPSKEREKTGLTSVLRKIAVNTNKVLEYVPLMASNDPIEEMLII